jgi:hypothetical protein
MPSFSATDRAGRGRHQAGRHQRITSLGCRGECAELRGDYLGRKPGYVRRRRRRAAYGGAVGPGGSPMGLRMQPRNEKFSTLFSKAGPNVVESAGA